MHRKKTIQPLIDVDVESITQSDDNIDLGKKAATTLRRHSQISWSSDTTSSSQSVNSLNKPKALLKKGRKNPASQPTKGLATSRYAPTENETAVAKARRAPHQAR